MKSLTDEPPRSRMHFISLNWITATVVLLAVTTILAAPVRNLDPDLIYYDNTRDESGYSFAYKTKDGQYREEQGYIEPETGILRVTGLYRFQGTDGKTYEFNYEADENGYRIVKKRPAFGAPISNTVLLSLVG
ncbi:endocuticle structural glycoprotein ABD-5-like [Anopheles moucheti]|uniref:endocuticle structural glycoprotein ABD-5-like n=1 Tax=Anopheles moucheti TaxID=186751 RepID=UPI0022F098EE|nr:endocuticle structural glycoprotein ABD-5-like [Anopheles moucheti]